MAGSTAAHFLRVFGVVDTGEFGPWGTRAFAAASMATNDAVYGNRGIIYKQQYNARIYQPIGSNGDFISVAIHYNQNRNNFFGSVPLRTDLHPIGRRNLAAAQCRLRLSQPLPARRVTSAITQSRAA